MLTGYLDNWMPASHDPQLKETARQLMEDEGLTLTETARRVGVAKQVVSDWAKAGDWRRTEVIRQVRIQEQKLVVDPVLDAAIQRLEKMPRQDREAFYDEAMHRLACSVPVILKQMTHSELVTKADKVAKLAELSRAILGRGEGKRQAPVLSLGILSANALPPRQQTGPENEDVVEAEDVTLTGDPVE